MITIGFVYFSIEGGEGGGGRGGEVEGEGGGIGEWWRRREMIK